MIDFSLIDDLSFTCLISVVYGKSTGSGFIINYLNSTFLITAKHVLFTDNGQLKDELIVVSTKKFDSIEIDTLMFNIDCTKSEIFYDFNIDACAILLNFGLDENNAITMIQKGTHPLLAIESTKTRPLKEVQIANEVILIGFPTSLAFANTAFFDITDCSAYFGNSGGPVIEIGRDGEMRVIGLVSRYIPFITEWRNNRETSISNVEYSNSGYSVCIPIDAIYGMIVSKLIV